MPRLRTAKIFTDRLSIERLSTSKDRYNQPTGARTTVVEDVPCKLLPFTGRPHAKRVAKDSTESTVSVFTVFLMSAANQATPADWTISEHDWIDVAGRKYDVLNVTDPLLSWLPIELLVERVKP